MKPPFGTWKIDRSARGMAVSSQVYVVGTKSLSVQGLQAQLVQLGLHRVFGAWLCSLPISGASTATVPLLRALAKVSCNEATLSWLHQQGVLEYVKELTNSEVSAVKERATALKVTPSVT